MVILNVSNVRKDVKKDGLNLHGNHKHKGIYSSTSVEAIVDAETSMYKDDLCSCVNSVYTKVVETSLYSATVK